MIRLLRRRAQAVRFLGEGVDDALTLHAAEVGVSVDTATAVEKDAADDLLLQCDLGVSTTGMSEGQRIFADTIKYVLSMLAGMQGAILLISAKRADAISSEVAVHTLDNANQLRQLIEANMALTETVAGLSREIHKHVCTPEHTAR